MVLIRQGAILFPVGMEYYRRWALLFQAKSRRRAENQGGAEMFRHTGLVQVGWLCISYTRNVPIAPLFQVRPGTYRKKEETEGGEMKMYDDYSIIGKDEVEWFSSRRGCTHPYGLLVRMLDAHNLDELNRLFQLDKDSHFRQKFEYELKIQ